MKNEALYKPSAPMMEHCGGVVSIILILPVNLYMHNEVTTVLSTAESSKAFKYYVSQNEPSVNAHHNYMTKTPIMLLANAVMGG